MKKNNTGLLIAILSVGVLILVALTLNLAMGGVWIVKGMDGKEGKSAYELAVENGFTGSLTDWLASLGGSGGKSAYEVAVDNGFVGSEQEWLLSLAFGEDGKDGKDGADGRDGEDGRNGRDGADGKNGKNGKDGISIKSVRVNEKGNLIVTLSNGETIDAGYVGGYTAPAKASDYDKAVASGYTGTRVDWLRGLQTGSMTGSDGKALTVTDCYRTSEGRLAVTMSDGTKLDAGELAEDGYLSDTVEAYGMRPCFEMAVMNWEALGLNLRDKPDITNGAVVGSVSQGAQPPELLCIGKGTVDGDVFLKFLLPDGQVSFAKRKYFEEKHATVTGAEGMNLPVKLTLTAGKAMRLVRGEIIPWADAGCMLEMTGSDGLTVTEENGIYTLTAASSGTYRLNVTVYRPQTVGRLELDRRELTVKVGKPKTVAGKTGLIIGDSRVNPTGTPASLPKALADLLPGVEWVGTRTNADNIKCEGMGGWTTADFTVSKDGANPFWNGSGFDFSYYIEKNPACRPDFVILNLGTNDQYSVASANRLAEMAKSIHDFDPTIRVLILTEYTRRPGDAAYADDVKWRLSGAYFGHLTDAVGGKESDGIYLIPNFLSVDLTDDRADAAHLTSEGYTHEADVIVTYLTDLLGT